MSPHDVGFKLNVVLLSTLGTRGPPADTKTRERLQQLEERVQETQIGTPRNRWLDHRPVLPRFGMVWYIGVSKCRVRGARGKRMTKLDDYLKITEAAEFLGVCKNTLRNWEASGKIEVYRNPMNGYRLYKKDDLAKLLAKIEPTVSVSSRPRSKPR